MKTITETIRRPRIRIALWTLVVALGLAAAALADDPPGRVGRLNFIEGSVSFQPPGVEDWTPATQNYPVTTGERFWTDRDSEAEIHVGRTALQMGPRSDVNVIQMTDQVSQVGLSQGIIGVRVRDLDSNSIFEVDTPGGAVSLLRPGFYRIDVDSDGNTSRVTVHQGLADVTADGSAFNIERGQEAIIYGGDSWSYDIEPAPGYDRFDDWCDGRDRHEDDLARERYISQQYVSPEMTGWEDLAGYGSWAPSPDYGQVWYPTVAAGWAPYSYGHWAWVSPWGWTWVDNSPWGFAPFHYGRWAFIGNRWGWVPGAYVARPYYAPALVTFVGLGGARPYGWFPLGPREVWVPGYGYSPAYIRRINYWPGARYEHFDVYNYRYVNRTYVVAAPGDVFIHGRAVDGRVAPRLSGGVVVSSRVTGMYPPVVPTRESVLVRSSARPVAAPPSAVYSRAMIYKTQPPARQVAFSRQVTLMRGNPGRPLDTTTLSRLPRTNPNFRATSATVVTAGGLKPRGEHTPKARRIESTSTFSSGQTGNPSTGGQSQPKGMKSKGTSSGVGSQSGPPSRPPRTFKYSTETGATGQAGGSGSHSGHHHDSSTGTGSGSGTGSGNPNVSGSGGGKHKNKEPGERHRESTPITGPTPHSGGGGSHSGGGAHSGGSHSGGGGQSQPRGDKGDRREKGEKGEKHKQG